MAESGAFHIEHCHAPRGYFAGQAAGLAWLAVPGGPRIARVLDYSATHIDTERIMPCEATARAAYDLGRALATMHGTGARAWGASPDGWNGPQYAGPGGDPVTLPVGTWPTWQAFYAEARLRSIATQGRERGALSTRDYDLLRLVADRIDQWACPGDIPARIHGDLWAGNVLWSRNVSGSTEAVLIDSAAHGGHRESDIAMLALFGSPHLGATIRGYGEIFPLSRAWHERLVVHQLYPIAVHAVVFGGGYISQLRDMADHVLNDLL